VDVVITMLSDPDAVRAVVTGPEGLLAGARAGLVHIDMSTVGPTDARDLVAMEVPDGVQVLHASVLGSIGPAERGELIVLVGGDQAIAEAQRPLLQTMGTTIHYLGANEHASAMKLAMNVLLAGSLQLCGEAVALATRWGVLPEQALAIITESPTAAPMLKAKAATMFDPQAPAEFALRLARKDLWLATTAGYQQTVALPLAAAALETYSMAMAAHGNEDVGRIAAFIATASGAS
jgi:3-hydroxyisobutyrate dehydrogenase-like beta-hydroxyacid dehydrogenase